jgi:hypothetical protein
MDAVSDSYQRLVEEIYPRLVDVITRRYQRNTDKSMQDVYRMDAAFLKLDADNLDFTLSYRKEIVEILEHPELSTSLVRLFVLSTLDFTYEHNQFIRLNEQDEGNLEKIYQAYLLALKLVLQMDIPMKQMQERLEKVIWVHFGNLRDHLARFLDARDGGLDGNAIFNRVVCRQYSPEFQLHILGIELGQIQTPVLDLGCGKDGVLVVYLNAHGVPAYGVDRMVTVSERLIASDWLEYSIGNGDWGTILSHMAFSNHFIFQHLYKNGKPEPYAYRYMEILRGLKPGGAFYYAPGLPFMESALPAALYQVRRRRVTGPVEVNGVMDQALYAAQILRRV